MEFHGGNAGHGGRSGRFWLGLLLGALLTSTLALTCGRDSSTAEDESPLADLVIARVGKRAITVRDLDHKIQVQFAAMMAGVEGVAAVQQKRNLLTQMLNQYAWVDAGERKGLDKDEEFKKTLELSRKFILSNVTVQRLVYSRSEPTEEEIRAYYDDNPDQFGLAARSQARHILLPTRALAERVRAQLLAGADFGALVREYSVDEMTKEIDGDMGVVTYRSELRGFGTGTELNEQIMALEVGEISRPIQSTRGFSLFTLTEKLPHRLQPYEEAREGIRQRLSTKRSNELFSAVLDSIRKETGAVIEEGAWEEYTWSLLDADDLFELAQVEKRPEQRIRIYEGLCERHPGSIRAPQAEFMIAFTYADDLRDYEKARAGFRKMLQLHPDHELAPSAQWMLENMEKGLDNLPYAGQIRRKATVG